MVSQRVQMIQMSGIRKMFEMAGEDTIMLGLGEPDFQPPSHVIEAYKRALDEGKNKYGSTFGLPELRKAIAKRLVKWRSDIDEGNVLVTVSATEALYSAVQSLFQRGDEILVPDPGFVLYRSHVLLSGGRPVSYMLREEDGFLPTQEELESLITHRTKGIIVNTPSNPTGVVFPEETVEMISDLAEDHNLIVVSDEVYDEIVYDSVHTSFLGRVDNLVYVNSFSKTYAMTGWRLGYLVTSKELLGSVAKIHYYTVACPPTPSQYAALAALDGSNHHLQEMLNEFRKRRDYILERLDAMDGFSCIKPEGAFYVFPTIEKKASAEEVAMALLKGGVLSTPGTAFGEGGVRNIRFSYANSLDNIRRGMDRVEKVLSSLE